VEVKVMEWANITITYTDADIPEGLNVSRVRLFNWDAGKSEWVKCEKSGIDLQAKVVWANVTVFKGDIFAPGTFDNSAPELKSARVVPLQGTAYNTYTFMVTYTDADGDLPIYIRVKIDDKYVWNMSEVDILDVNVIDGKKYELDIQGVYLKAGNHTFQFSAHDGTYSAKGDTGVHPWPRINNSPPVAVAKAGRVDEPLRTGNITVRAGDSITFDATASCDIDEDPLTYLWDFGDGTTAEGVSVVHKYKNPGTYIAKLFVDDGIHKPVTDEITVKVFPKEVPPTPPTDLTLYYIIFSVLAIVVMITILGAAIITTRREAERRAAEEMWRVRRPLKRKVVKTIRKKAKGVVEIEEYECEECGAVVSIEDTECPECGKIFEEEEEVEEEERKKKKKKVA
jgi:hypothetical protein